MELINPRITVQNTDTPFWIVSMEHDFGEHEHMSFTLFMDRSGLSVGRMQQEAIGRAISLLEAMHQALDAAP